MEDVLEVYQRPHNEERFLLSGAAREADALGT